MKIIQMHNSTISQMMGYLLITEAGHVIAVDGGTTGDSEAFQKLVKHYGGHIDLWLLTHPHSDHVGVFWDMVDHGTELTVDCIGYSPSEEDFQAIEELEYFREDIGRFKETVSRCQWPFKILQAGQRMELDELVVDILRVVNPALKKDYINSLSVVFKVTDTRYGFTMLFLGDLSWTCGDELLEAYGDQPEILHVDAVQMAHHGQWGVEENVYQAIAPKWSFWPTPDWLYTNTPEGSELGSGPWRTLETREWMDRIGAVPVTSMGHHTLFDTRDCSVEKWSDKEEKPMKLTVENHVLRRRYDDFRAVDMIAEAGFDGIDFAFYDMGDWKEIFEAQDPVAYAKRLRAYAEEKGVSFCQAHAPFEFRYGMGQTVEDPVYARIVKSMEFAALLGIPAIVIHAIGDPDSPDYMQINYDYYRSFLPYCEKYDIKVCVENLMYYHPETGTCTPEPFGTPELFNEMIDWLDSPYYVGCVDLGHAKLTGCEPEDFLLGAGKRVQYLHVHENDGHLDLHRLPLQFSFHWDKIMKALKEIDYQGNFNFAIINYLNIYENEMLPAALKFAAETGRYLMKKMEQP